MKKFHAINFETDWDARSYYGMTALIVLNSRKLHNYTKSHKAYDLQLWSDKDIYTFFENFPDCATGRYHQKNPQKRPQVDYWDSTPIIIGSLCAIVTKRFIDVMNDVGVSRDEYFIKEIKVDDDILYMLFVPYWDCDVIDYQQSEFYVEKYVFMGVERIPMRISSLEEYLMMLEKGSYPYPRFKKAVLHSEFQQKDIFRFSGGRYPCISERLFDALMQKGIKGFVTMDMEVFAED